MGKNIITASIVTYNTDEYELTTILNCCLNSVIDKIFIVDNSPSDVLKSFSLLSDKIEYIFGQGNIGYGSAHNIAISKSIDIGAVYHIILNPDILFDSRQLADMGCFMDNNQEVAHLMPKVIYPDGELQYLCKLLPSPMDLIGRRFIPSKVLLDRLNFHFEMRASGYNKLMLVPFLSGCFMFFRVEALKAVNGFDDNFFMYCEDIDLCRRIGMAGYKSVFNPEFTIIHAHKKESFKSKSMLRAHIRSAVYYFNKWGWIFDKYRDQLNKEMKQQYE